ncbi:P63C domain-containing protein [uncultured Bartonella sp.]|uniref:P63C domain-containing protein n=1 Tax=uncultured Bartonella sp. TaxID=104108 RepID=UPI00260D1057|nr:P63C domain-containing protein [uncultured Bartonella sp.]
MKEEIKRYALLSGPLPIGDVDLECAVLDDETRVLSATSIFKAFKRPRQGVNTRLEIAGNLIPPFLAAKNLEPYINQDVIARTKLIKYKDGNAIKSGYNSELLAEMCNVYLSARRDGALVGSQLKLADQAEILQSAFAKLGIAAIIDEATGYQKVRSNDALRILLARYVAEGVRKWIKTFPDSFFSQLDRLYGNEKTTSKNRPIYYGRFINKYIYEPIENGYVKAQLDKLNITDEGVRKARFHQWLTDQGRDTLIRQLGRVEGRMEIAPNIEEFKRLEEKQKTITIAPYLFNEMNKLIEN